MANRAEIYEGLRSRIPSDLWDKYSHLSFKEMAGVDELQRWSVELKQADAKWFELEELSVTSPQ